MHLKTLRKIRAKFQPFNIFVHMCNGCHEVGQMLHTAECVLCGQKNYFFERELVVDQANDSIVRDLLVKLKTFK